jgi:hypothetical protein
MNTSNEFQDLDQQHYIDKKIKMKIQKKMSASTDKKL